MATDMMAVSNQLPWLTAAMMPIEMPSVAAIASAAAVSCTVDGTSRMESSTAAGSAAPRPGRLPACVA
jgi:hypothetical protein